MNGNVPPWGFTVGAVFIMENRTKSTTLSTPKNSEATLVISRIEEVETVVNAKGWEVADINR